MGRVQIALSFAFFAAVFLVSTETSVAQTGFRDAYRRQTGYRGYSRYHPNRTVRDQVFRRPTVSPYLQLVDRSSPSSTPYHSLVRPQLEQQQINRRQNIALQQLRQQTNAVRAQRSRTEGIRATGHQTFFQNLSHYYPGARR